MIKSAHYLKKITAVSMAMLAGIVIVSSLIFATPVGAAVDDDEDGGGGGGSTETKKEEGICQDKNKDGKVDAKDLKLQGPCQYPTEGYCAKGEQPSPTNPCLLQTDPAAKECTGGDCSTLITKYVNPLIRLLSALVGVVVVISIVVGGIQYASSGGDPSKVAAAKKRIFNSLIALLAYFFLFSFLQWLIPGGII